MTESLLDLAESFDVLSERGDGKVSKLYLESLKEFSSLCASNDERFLKGTLNIANQCLKKHSGTGNRQHGLQILSFLADDAKEDFVEKHAKQFLDFSFKGLMSKESRESDEALKLLLSVLERTRKSSDLHQQLNSSISGLVQTLISEKTEMMTSITATALISVLEVFPRPCGNHASSIEKMVLRSIQPDCRLPVPLISRLFSILPFLGGGGKENIGYRQKWTAYAQDVVSSLRYLISQHTKAQTESRQGSLSIPVPPNDGSLVQKAHFITHQIKALTSCLTELFRKPALSPKSFNLSEFFKMFQMAFGVNFSDLMKSPDLIDKISLSILPEVQVSVMEVTEVMIELFRHDLLTFVPIIVTSFIQALEGLRRDADIYHRQVIVPKWKSKVLSIISKLAQTLGGSSGLHLCATRLLPLIFSELVPSEKGLTLNKIVRKEKSKKRKHASFEQKSKNAILFSPTSVCLAALHALADLLESSGAMLSDNIMKDTQAIILALATNVVQGSDSENSPYQDHRCRKELFRCLLALVTNSNSSWAPPTGYASKLLKIALMRERHHLELVSFIENANKTLEHLLHPSAPSFNLDSSLSSTDIAEIKKSLMRVHVITVGQKSKNLDFIENPKSTISLESELLTNNDGKAIKSDTESQEDTSSEPKKSKTETKFMKDLIKDCKQKVDKPNDPDLEECVIVTEEERKAALAAVYDFSKPSIFIPEETKNPVHIEKSTDDEIKSHNEAKPETKKKVDLEALKMLFVNECSDEEEDENME